MLIYNDFYDNSYVGDVPYVVVVPYVLESYESKDLELDLLYFCYLFLLILLIILYYILILLIFDNFY